MPIIPQTAVRLLVLLCASAIAPSVIAKEPSSLAELKATGLQRSRFISAGHQDVSHPDVPKTEDAKSYTLPQANLSTFESTIKPLLDQHCIDCHGSEISEGNLRIDTLDPNLVAGADTDWWSEIFAVVTKGEMPPPDDGDLDDRDRQTLVDWLSIELQTASLVRSKTGKRSAFRRMTRYEYNYALQDLLGLEFDFAKDLPPEANSDEGFQNRSDLLHLSVSQFEMYQRIARNALAQATVRGAKPQTHYWDIPVSRAAEREWTRQDNQIQKLQNDLKDEPDKLTAELEKLRVSFEVPRQAAYFRDLSSDRTAQTQWNYQRAEFAFGEADQLASISDQHDCVAVLPNGRSPKLIFELGNQLPDDGTMRVTVQAARADSNDDYVPNLQLMFGWQASNEGRALLRVSKRDTPITADPKNPQIVQWHVPLGEIYPRNNVRKTSPMGALPSPSEYIRLVNSSARASEIQITHVQVAAPVYDQWPPESHRRIFPERDSSLSEDDYARDTIAAFMKRAWRRPVSDEEVSRKLELFNAMRPLCESVEDAVLEVLATVLSSPQFLYVANESGPELVTEEQQEQLGRHALATRLALFLWCSVPDTELLNLADSGQLSDPDVLKGQVRRMLDDPRSQRFVEHFVHQWLDLQLLEFQNFNQNVRGFDPLLKEAMLWEPVALFSELLKSNATVLDFIHCDYAIVNERLARHYGIPNVRGNHFQKVPLHGNDRRGGILTQAGILAMNSDWPDSHPLKRAIWLLESVLADPPPPPPPAVPQIDLADPEIAKMTLKERIEDHRNHAACMSCHEKIDPWGIAFENYDALGKWRDEIGGKPVDASSELFNHQTLDGMNGLKRFLLDSRQDQFVQAMASKLTTYALGRQLNFSDRAEMDAITAEVRQNGDGLRTLIEAIVTSDLYQPQ
ncbi:hypothetical protein Pla22_36250 [Rubripirellula amarantea]|uniref:Planctomycete cytochrome C n=1 Tax=Rubripirellula amarantea TaxID=2527999 RepID=A0A5C5WM65_9BACT|nr:DUF1592 domain-containing protein [Rubripirellula amarantea]TWT50882.1 hypothetical protein Pla22_36250 [Rubripirellula amarantea]